MAEKQGCSVVVVVMIALVCIVLGVVAGGLGFMFFGVQEVSGDSPIAVDGDPAIATPPAVPTAGSAPDYALLYPIEESLRVEGKLEQKAVTDQVKNKRFELRKCYQTALTKNPDLKGEMSLQFTVSGDTGKVIAALERHTDIGDSGVKKCILDEVKSWKMPATKAGESVVKFDILMIPISSASADLK